MKNLLIELVWFAVVLFILTVISAVGASLFLPDADMRAVGATMTLPMMLVAAIVTHAARKLGKLPGIQDKR